MKRTIVVSLLIVSTTAWADDPPPRMLGDEELAKLAEKQAASEDVVLISGSIGDSRSVAEEFLVLPEGLDAGARIRAITAEDALGTGKLKLTDLALFDVHAEWAIARHFELDVAASLLPKQPSATHEDVFQGGSVTLRRDLVGRTALGLSGAEHPLIGMKGQAFDAALFVTHKHRLNEIVTFALTGGANSTYVRAEMDHPMLVEAAGHAAVLVRVPNGVWGGWLGVGYALPVYQRGNDPVSGMPIDPQPRLDISIGNAVQLAEKWDLAAELTILDRGDLAVPATRLPILDGGFDQIQVTVGVTRRFDWGKSDEPRRGISDPIELL